MLLETTQGKTVQWKKVMDFKLNARSLNFTKNTRCKSDFINHVPVQFEKAELLRINILN